MQCAYLSPILCSRIYLGLTLLTFWKKQYSSVWDLLLFSWKDCFPWIHFASLSSFDWYLWINFKHYINSVGFSSLSYSAHNQAWSTSTENALLLPFVLWSRLILTIWQEDNFSSACRLYCASLALCFFHRDLMNHFGTQRMDLVEHEYFSHV